MVMLALALLVLAAAMGGAASLAWLGDGSRPMPSWLGGAHGAVALGGLATLILALQGAHPSDRMGTQSFGAIAALTFAAAASFGLLMLLLRRMRRHIPGVLVGFHAMLAVTGLVVLLAYALLA